MSIYYYDGEADLPPKGAMHRGPPRATIRPLKSTRQT